MQINIREARTHLSRPIRYALESEEVVIAKRSRALVRLEVLPGAGSSLVSALSGD